MLDTVGFRIHDLDKHQHLIDFLEDVDTGITNYDVEIPKDEFSSIMRAKKDVRVSMVKYGLSFNKVTHHSMKSHNNFIKVPSSHYDISFQINIIRDYVEFQLSIPKYIYGHNIAQFVTSPFNKNFESVNHEMKSQKASLYKRFYKFMQYFLVNEFVDLEIDLKLVEITRLDLCFNQYFHSKEDALSYLDIQKQIKFSRKRSNSNINARPTSLTYLPKGRSHSFKIYHKGSEYEKNDKRKHNKINKKLGKVFFDTDYLQKQADCVLRYEITYRSKHFDLRYNNRPICETHQYVGSFRKNSKLAYKQRIAYNSLKSKVNKGIMLKGNEKSFYTRYHKSLNKSHKFYLDTSWEIKRHERTFSNDDLSDTYSEATFDNNLMNYLFDEFFDYCKSFQVQEMPTITQVISKIKNHNKETKYKKDTFKDVYKFLDKDDKKSLPTEKYVTPIVSFLRLLEKYTLNEILNLGILTRATYYRRLKDLKNLGINNNNISGYSTINTDLSFSHYFGESISSSNSMFPNNYTENFF